MVFRSTFMNRKHSDSSANQAAVNPLWDERYYGSLNPRTATYFIAIEISRICLRGNYASSAGISE